jgi:uncharacterized protein with PQ loop repeat
MIEQFWIIILGSLSTEALGFAAGITISLSALPQIARNQTHCAEASQQSASRNALLVFGNLMWTIYGITKGAPAIVVMCGIGALLNCVVLLQVCRARALLRRLALEPSRPTDIHAAAIVPMCGGNLGRSSAPTSEV